MTTEKKQFALDVMVTAVEGGIGYWSACTAYHWEKDDKEDLDGFYADIEDDGEDEEFKFRIDAESVWKGIETLYKQEGYEGVKKTLSHAIVDHDAGMIDAEIADCIIQAAVFGEVVYG